MTLMALLFVLLTKLRSLFSAFVMAKTALLASNSAVINLSLLPKPNPAPVSIPVLTNLMVAVSILTLIKTYAFTPVFLAQLHIGIIFTAIGFSSNALFICSNTLSAVLSANPSPSVLPKPTSFLPVLPI